ncbi:MAG: hypothetical protein KKG01_01395 [Candidatus Omnitrophica bacterium]|nr:hypothetical protein [Candidatus Omnitrophota bacterium]
MIKFRKDYNVKIISLLLVGVFFITSTGYGIDLSETTHLRKQLDFSNKEENPRYLCTMVAAAIHKSILLGKNGDTWKEILEPVISKYKRANLLESVQRQGIHIEKDIDSNIWNISHQQSNTEIIVLPDGQFGPKDIVLAKTKEDQIRFFLESLRPQIEKDKELSAEEFEKHIENITKELNINYIRIQESPISFIFEHIKTIYSGFLYRRPLSLLFGLSGSRKICYSDIKG